MINLKSSVNNYYLHSFAMGSRFVFGNPESADSNVQSVSKEPTFEDKLYSDQGFTEDPEVAKEIAKEEVSKAKEKANKKVANKRVAAIRLIKKQAETQAFTDVMSSLNQSDINGVKQAFVTKTPIDKFTEWASEVVSGVSTEEETQETKELRSLLNAPANAFYNVGKGVLNIPNTIKSINKMASSISMSSLSKAGKIAYTVFMNHMSPMEKVTFGIQFIGESIVGAGLGKALNAIGKAPIIMNLMTKVSMKSQIIAKTLSKTVRATKKTGNLATGPMTGRVVKES